MEAIPDSCLQGLRIHQTHAKENTANPALLGGVMAVVIKWGRIPRFYKAQDWVDGLFSLQACVLTLPRIMAGLQNQFSMKIQLREKPAHETSCQVKYQSPSWISTLSARKKLSDSIHKKVRK